MKILLRSEQSDGHVSAIDMVVPPRAPRNVPHTFANQSDSPAHMVIICTPAGIEREFARRIANQAGEEPPEWALQPTPEVIRVGPPIGE